MKNYFKKIGRGVLAALMLGLGALGMSAQNSLPAPGSGGSFQPNVSPSFGGGWGGGWGAGWGGGFNPGPPPPSYWGSPWYDGWNYNPTIIVQPTVERNPLSEQGITKVVSCGYDIQGVWRVVPLTVSYQAKGSKYVVNVLNAWNPWTDKWDRGIDEPAYAVNYKLKGITYHYYVELPTGTFYFNL